MCFSLLHLTVEFRDLSQAEKNIIVTTTADSTAMFPKNWYFVNLFLKTYKIIKATSDINTAYAFIGVFSKKPLMFNKSLRETEFNPKTLLSWELAIMSAAADVKPRMTCSFKTISINFPALTIDRVIWKTPTLKANIIANDT